MFSARTAEGDVAPGYKRHRPEKTLLYQIIERHYPDFRSAMEAQDRPLPGYVQDEFEAFLQCGRLEHGFLRVRCEDCKHEDLVAFSWCLELETIRSPREGGGVGEARGLCSSAPKGRKRCRRD